MLNNFEEQVVAMGGIYQASALARQLARTGECDLPAYRASIASIFVTDAAETIDIFGTLDALALGLSELAGKSTDIQPSNIIESTRYAATMAALAGKLLKRSDMLDALAERIRTVKADRDTGIATGSDMDSLLARIYSQTISTLEPKIMVHGDANLLQNDNNVNRIRAALLAGVRAAVLWRQLKGDRLRWLFFRNRYSAVANTLVRRSIQH